MQNKEKFKIWTENETEAAFAGGIVGLGIATGVSKLTFDSASLNKYVSIPKPEIKPEAPEGGIMAIGVVLGMVLLTSLQVGVRRLAYRDRRREAVAAFDKTFKQIRDLPETKEKS